MTIQEFEAYLSEHEVERKKFEELKTAITAENEEELAEALSKAAADVGCEVAASEFMLEEVVNGPLDDEELEKVSGGRSWCWAKNACYGIVRHSDDQHKEEACWYDYLCKTVRHGKVQDVIEDVLPDALENAVNTILKK